MERELAVWIQYARVHDLGQPLTAVKCELMTILVDSLLTAQPLAERNGYDIGRSAPATLGSAMSRLLTICHTQEWRQVHRSRP